jgi:hypothetical protein
VEKVVLSHHLNFYLDNPRTVDEISTVKDYLLEAYEMERKERSLLHSYRPVEDFERILFEFRDVFSGSDKYITKFFDSYEREHIFEFIASMWVIARFDDEGQTQFIKEELARLSHLGKYEAFLEDDHPIIRNSVKLINYSYLLSLLAHSEADYYFGRCFISEPNQGIHGEPVEKLWRDFLTLETVVESGLQDEMNKPLQWMFLPSALGDLQKTAQLLEQTFDEGQTDKLLYIGGILKIASYDTRDVKIAIVMLTSIIELLLTHNPNTIRFNVEDSISKQFQLKASILIYLNNKREDINHIKKRLKIIYEQRSNIAHGNFGELHRYINKLSKKEDEEEGF